MFINYLSAKKSFVLLSILFIVIFINNSCVVGQYSDWTTFNYDHLINKSIITHSGDTVGSVILQLDKYESSYKGLVQTYLEPYSSYCNDRLQAVKGADKEKFINILAHYPVGSEQPAWAALFREGHYQLYYNNNTIRLFLTGDRPEESFQKHRSVVRHPIRDVVNSSHLSIQEIEIYVFRNDYSKREIRLNTTPLVYPVSDIDLSSRHTAIDLDSIEKFLNHHVILEAVEISDNNDLFFYGRGSDGETIAGKPLSLSDIAVIYRSVFHYGYNAPYISLDTHEDNRYAKVNFGGHLQNTHVGSVVLEADKLFKTLSTGLDPNTYRSIVADITRYVPDFLTENERNILLASNTAGNRQIRYWFYPDEIGTVTDGSIAVVDNWQFLSDAERTDTEIELDEAVRTTINHLNRNYARYEKAHLTLQELSNVGRIMALVNWLKEMNIGDRVDLDALLSVKIPAHTTPERTKKLLAVTAAVSYDGFNLNRNNVRNYTKTFNMSELLDNYPPNTADEQFLNRAQKKSSDLDLSGIYPEQIKKLASDSDHYEKLLDNLNRKMEELDTIIETRRTTLNRSNSAELNQFNAMVERYNNMLAEQRELTHRYNAIVDSYNRMNIGTQVISSIGGGISLEPHKFKKPVLDSNSPKIRTIKTIKPQLTPRGSISESDDWIRSNPGTGEARINPLPKAG